jgi:hypothetical protein
MIDLSLLKMQVPLHVGTGTILTSLQPLEAGALPSDVP